MEDPCYKLGGGFAHIGDWVGTNQQVGFFWENMVQNYMTRTLIRVEYVSCEPFLWGVRVNLAPALHFENPYGLIPYKNFCINSICQCHTETGTWLEAFEVLRDTGEELPAPPSTCGIRVPGASQSIELPRPGSIGGFGM